MNKIILLAATTIRQDALKQLMSQEDTQLIWNNNTINDEGYKSWVTYGTDSELLPMIAGKICYDSIGKGKQSPKAYHTNILSSFHGSIYEHVYFTFYLSMSRVCSHELIRHRAGAAISQRSQRYVNEADASTIPGIISQSPAASQIYTDAVNLCKQSYGDIIDALEEELIDILPIDKTERRKILRSAARRVLPESIETRLIWTANVRALRNIFELRCNSHAEEEIRRLFNTIFELVYAEAPSIFEDYSRIFLKDGTFELVTEYRKV